MDNSMTTTEKVIQQCKSILKNHYASQLDGIILYGSVARKENEAQSDIDLLVVLKRPFDYFAELRTIIDLLYPIQLDSEQLISARPALVDEFETGTIQLYRNAKREGITV